jgi:hypothetical protein
VPDPADQLGPADPDAGAPVDPPPDPGAPSPRKRGPGRPRGARTRNRSSSKNKPKPAKPSSPQPGTKAAVLEALRDDIDGMLAMGSLVITPGSPTAGMFLAGRTTSTADALVRLAANNPRLLKAMQSAAHGTAYGEIAGTVAGILLAVRCDLAGAPYDSPARRFLGVDDAFREAHPDWFDVDGNLIAPAPAPDAEHQPAA